jgi:hypothetical protein
MGLRDPAQARREIRKYGHAMYSGALGGVVKQAFRFRFNSRTLQVFAAKRFRRENWNGSSMILVVSASSGDLAVP